MKRSLTPLFAAAAVAATTVSADSCPCFTAEQYDAIIATFPGQSGCHFDVSPNEVNLGSSVSYIFSGGRSVAVIQAAVTVEDMDGSFVEGGICGVGGALPAGLTLLNKDAVDYGEGNLTPEAFQDCVDIMQAKCHSTCGAGLVDLADNRAGCGQMPTALN